MKLSYDCNMDEFENLYGDSNDSLVYGLYLPPCDQS
jgi:hypothetical protein